MTLSPKMQSLVDQLVQELGLQGMRPSGIEIHLDNDGFAMRISPMLVYRRERILTDKGESARN